MEIVAIGDQDTLLGFRLAGVTTGFVFSEEKSGEIVDACKDAALVIVTEAVAQYLRSQELVEKLTGVLVEIPDSKGSSGSALEEIGRLYEEAIGVKLKEE